MFTHIAISLLGFVGMLQTPIGLRDQISKPIAGTASATLQQRSPQSRTGTTARVTAKKNSTANTCPKPRANLIVANFGTAPVLIYVNGKKVGSVGSQTEKRFKQVLPPGSPLVEARGKNDAGSISTLASAFYEVPKSGQKTCRITKAVLIGFPAMQPGH